MKYMIMGFGDYDVDVCAVNNISTLEDAQRLLDKKVKRWCKEHDVDVEELDNYGLGMGETEFSYGEEDEGLCAYKIYEVPDFKNKIEELLFEAKIEMDAAAYAADNYAWSLMDNCVGCHTANAQDYIDKALKLMNS